MIGNKTQHSENKGQKKATMAFLRLQKDLKSYQQNKLDYAELEFPHEGSLQQIIVTINLNLKKEDLQQSMSPFSLNFPDSYPIDPPKLKCLNKIYHPNISYTGSVCLPLVRQDWTPTVSLEQIIYGLIFILLYPNGEDALEPEIGDQMKSDYKLYQKIVYHTIEGRVFKQKQYDHIRT